MSENSFPRPEHESALQEYIGRLAHGQSAAVRISSAGLDRYRCHYRFRLQAEQSAWQEELSVHFQVAQRIMAGEPVEGFARQLREALVRCREFATGSKD